MILKHAATWQNIALYVNDSGDAFSLTSHCGLKLKAVYSGATGRHQRKYRTRSYNQICISYYENGTKHKNFFNHVLVCTAYHGQRPSPDYVVDHIDRDCWNNTPSNLRWVTYLENRLNSIDHIRKLERERLEREKRALLSARPVQLTINF